MKQHGTCSDAAYEGDMWRTLQLPGNASSKRKSFYDQRTLDQCDVSENLAGFQEYGNVFSLWHSKSDGRMVKYGERGNWVKSRGRENGG
jgi:hypothetical protein